MSTAETGMFVGLFINTVGLAIVLFKLVWGSASAHHTQFNILEKACTASIAAVRNEIQAKVELQYTNFGNVVANVSDRIHQLELKAMETRSLSAETYMRRDSYHKATDEFKRDVRDAHSDLKTEMHKGFDDVREQINAVSMSIEAGRRDRDPA